MRSLKSSLVFYTALLCMAAMAMVATIGRSGRHLSKFVRHPPSGAMIRNSHGGGGGVAKSVAKIESGGHSAPHAQQHAAQNKAHEQNGGAGGGIVAKSSSKARVGGLSSSDVFTETNVIAQQPLRVLPMRPIRYHTNSDEEQDNGGHHTVPQSPATSSRVISCVSRGMQQKCLFRNLVVHRNKFSLCRSGNKKERRNDGIDGLPPVIYPADGQVAPLKQYHKYTGHRISIIDEGTAATTTKSKATAAHDDVNGGINSTTATSSCPCTHIVETPTVFLYRMSGHSTYHLWENNIGPFYSTLTDSFLDVPMEEQQATSNATRNSNSKRQKKTTIRTAINDPGNLIIAFVDNKPVKGPKAPILLDQLLRSFTKVPLINASRIDTPVCFSNAIVGISANSFPHGAVLMRLMRNIAGYAPPPPLGRVPRILFISRNHPKVIRGRKIANEAEALAALRSAVASKCAECDVEYVHMENYTYAQQVQLSMKANIMFSPHGGGVANCIWMRKGSVMVEFVAPVGKTLPGMYHAMCQRSGVRHFHFLADPDPADAKLSAAELSNNARLFSNMVVPPAVMKENALKALELYAASYDKESKKSN